MTTTDFDAPPRPVVELDGVVLAVGAHDSPADGVCVMEAVSCVAGERWSDRPACVSPVIGRFLRRWNDTLPSQLRQELKRFICPVIGTRSTEAHDVERVWLVCDWLVREYAPVWLRLGGLADIAEGLATLGPLGESTATSTVPSLESARLAAVIRAHGAGFEIGVIRRASRETGWDAAAATLVPDPWDESPNEFFALALDVGLTSIGTAPAADVAAVTGTTRESAKRLVERLCTVGRSGDETPGSGL
jgi:hypothetical protein